MVIMSLERVFTTEQTSNSKIGISVKFTRSMEEVLLTLLLLCSVQNKWSAIGLVNQLIAFTGRTAKTIGTTLQKLANMNLINYSKQGRDQNISLNFSNEFLQIMLVTLFGFTEEESENSDEEKFHFNNGLLPANLNFSKYVSLLEELLEETDEEIRDYKHYLEWIADQNRWAEEMKLELEDSAEIANNPIFQFADDLVNKFENEVGNHVNGLTFPIQKKFVLDRLKADRVELPWVHNSGSQKKRHIDDE